jgi:hypothetical protein
MTSGKRGILIAVVVLLLLVAGGLYYLAANLNGIIGGLIESQGSAATQTAVRVSGVDIRPRDASAGISGLSVANPEGFQGNAIELGGFSIKLDAGSLTQDTIIISDIMVSEARINVLQQGTRNNLQELLGNLQQLQSDDSTPAEEGDGKKIIINRFTLEGVSASVSIPELDEMRDVTLPTIVVRDIGRASNGATGAQVAQQILRPVLEKAIASAATQAVKDEATRKIGDAVGGFLKGIGGDKGD